MNFKDALIMCGPAGVACDHSVYNKSDEEKQSPINNHWLKNDNGTVIVRGGDFDSDYEILETEDYINGSRLPHLLTVVDKDIVPAKLSIKDMDSNWRVMSSAEVQDLLDATASTNY